VGQPVTLKPLPGQAGMILKSCMCSRHATRPAPSESFFSHVATAVRSCRWMRSSVAIKASSLLLIMVPA
jgi:hypothetical protein